MLYWECKEGYLIKCSLICYSAELEILSSIHLGIKDEIIQNDITLRNVDSLLYKLENVESQNVDKL